jgi:DNA ligase (NAD+)
VTDSTASKIERLREQIREHDRRYYIEAAPVISDLDYDRLLEELRLLETAHPELITPESPTQRVGDAAVDELTSVRHVRPMLSMDNTYSEGDLAAWAARTAKQLGSDEPIEWVLELKIDGVAVSTMAVLLKGQPAAMALWETISPTRCGPWEACRCSCRLPRPLRGLMSAARST